MTHEHTDDEPNTTDASVLCTDGGSEASSESASESTSQSASEPTSESESAAKSADEGDKAQGQQEPEATEESEATEAEESTGSEGDPTQDTDDSESHEETPSEPTGVEADNEAVVEQTGDVGVEPQHDETEAESAESDAESAESSPAFDSEGGTASIIEVRNQVIELSTDVIGRSLDGIVEISRTDEAWRAVVEIIERRSVPDTQDILGQYEIELDDDGEVIGYRRLEKYRRADTGPSQR